MGDVPAGAMILDFGPESVADLKRRLAAVRTVLWNGPLGAFETAPFGEATFALAREVARLTKEGKLVSVAGGGDTVRALNEAEVAARLQLCLDRGRGVPGMARRGATAGGRGARQKRSPRLSLAENRHADLSAIPRLSYPRKRGCLA